jgi:hypothetical protein
METESKKMSCICSGLQYADHSDRSRRMSGADAVLRMGARKRRFDRLRRERSQDRDVEWSTEGSGSG